jgi:hypothetical protein
MTPPPPTNDPQHRPPNIYDPANVNNSISFREWVRDWIGWSEKKPTVPHEPQSESTETTVVELPDELGMLKHLLDDPNFGPGWSIIPKSERAEIALLERLNKIKGCPLSLYDDIISWVQEHLQSESGESDGNIIPLLRKRERCLKHFESCAHAEAARPVTTTVQLQESEGSVNLTKIPFLPTLYGMLTDTELIQDGCLLMNGPSPYSNPEKKPAVFDDFNTGSRYIDSHFNLKQDDIDYPLGIINFIDASVFDKSDRLGTEMVAFTISLLNRETRNKSQAWRSLGSIPNFKRVDHKSADEKIVDYHLLLGELLLDIEILQRSKAGILWPLMYGGKFHMIRIKPYMLCSLGDTPGQNALTGKMKGNKSRCHCRYCNIPKNELSNPWYRGVLTTKAKVLDMQDNPAKLKELSYKKVDNAWTNLDFGGCPYGIHGSVPGEIVHALQHGIMAMATDGLFFTKAITGDVRDKNRRVKKRNLASSAAAEKRRKLAISAAPDGAPTYETSIDENNLVLSDIPEQDIQKKEEDRKKLLKNGVFGGQLGREVTHISRCLGREGQHQSDRDLPPINFSQGITTRSKTTASEQQGITFLTNLILCSTYALNIGGIEERIGEEKMGKFINVLEQLMCLEEFMKTTRQKGIKRTDLPAIKYFTCVLLDTIKQAVNRQQGDGFDTIKFHLLVHMVGHDILRFASPANISGSAGECQFKDNFKLCASTGQLRDLLFDQQLYERRHQHMFITRCAQRVKRADALAEHLLTHNSSTRDGDEAPPNDFASELHQHLKHGSAEQDGDLAGSRFGSGLSCPAYMVQMVKNNHDPNSQYSPNIVYCGKPGTSRHTYLYRPDLDLIGWDGKPAGTKNTCTLKDCNSKFFAIVQALAHMFDTDPALKIPIFTEMRKDNILYRADPCSPYALEQTEKKNLTTAWCDWALFRQNDPATKRNERGSAKEKLYPGQILGFVTFDTVAAAAAFNASCAPEDKVGSLDGSGYAISQLTSEDLEGFLDPTTPPVPKQQLQANSSIFFWGQKVVVEPKGPLRRDERNPTIHYSVRPMNISLVAGPVAAFQDFAPDFVHKNDTMTCNKWIKSTERAGAFIFVRPRAQWSQVFLGKARKAYRQHKLDEKARLNEGSKITTTATAEKKGKLAGSVRSKKGKEKATGAAKKKEKSPVPVHPKKGPVAPEKASNRKPPKREKPTPPVRSNSGVSRTPPKTTEPDQAVPVPSKTASRRSTRQGGPK